MRKSMSEYLAIISLLSFMANRCKIKKYSNKSGNVRFIIRAYDLTCLKFLSLFNHLFFFHFICFISHAFSMQTRQYNSITSSVVLGEVDIPSYSGPDVPDNDVDDNPNAQPPPPSAPPVDMFGTLPGYENVGFGQ